MPAAKHVEVFGIAQTPMLYFVLALCVRLNHINKTTGYVQTIYIKRVSSS